MRFLAVPRTARLVVVTIALTAVSAPAQPQERGMGGIVGITVYDDRDFRGRNANFRNDVADLRPSGMNDRIVSLEIARGETWEVASTRRSADVVRCSRGTRTTCASGLGSG